MRLLVTNTVIPPAYYVVRALRPYADTIIATTYGPRPVNRWPTCHSAYSRLVDRRYSVLDPERDWHEGRIQPENTEREQAYIDAIVDICDRDKIDTIFPTSDDRIYIFSKNKKMFSERGIVIPVPDYDTVLNPLDKFQTIRCAEEAGFPCPRTYLPESDADVLRIARELDPPWVIKPRFTSGGRGLAIVNHISELLGTIQTVRRHHGMPMLQEYIPGRGKQHFYLVLDREGQARSVFTPKVVRTRGRLTRNQTAACVSMKPHPLTDQAVRMLRSMSWWGSATIQTKLDQRDGQPKLMEINPRLGNGLWLRTELGINEPLLCLQIASGKPITANIEYPLNCILLQPIEDIVSLPFELIDLSIYRFRTAVWGKQVADSLAPPMTLRERLTSYKDQYFKHKSRIYSPYFRYLIEDPLPTLIWTVKQLQNEARATMQSLGH